MSGLPWEDCSGLRYRNVGYNFIIVDESGKHVDVKGKHSASGLERQTPLQESGRTPNGTQMWGAGLRCRNGPNSWPAARVKKWYEGSEV